jgi:hypothetical protein
VRVTLADGYPDPTEDTVEINATTLSVFASPSSQGDRAESALPSLGA